MIINLMIELKFTPESPVISPHFLAIKVHVSLF